MYGAFISFKQWKPIKLSKNVAPVSHLVFANDLLLVGEVSCQQMETMLLCLNKYYAAS